MDVFPCGFPNFGIKKARKSKQFSFLRSEERENVKKKILKKKSIFPLQGAFSLIFVGNLPEKKIRKFFGGKEKNQRVKKK